MEYTILSYLDGFTGLNVCYCYDLKIVGFGGGFESALNDLESSVRDVLRKARRFPESSSFISSSEHCKEHREMFESVSFEGRGPNVVSSCVDGIQFNVYNVKMPETNHALKGVEHLEHKRFFDGILERDRIEEYCFLGRVENGNGARDDVIEDDVFEDDIPF